jgi:hypothetical protein
MADAQGADGAGGPAFKTPRQHARRPVELPVTLVRGDDRREAEILFDTGDVSLGGAFLRSAVLLEIDDELDLELVLPAGRGVRARGRIVRVSQDPPGMGIAFTNLAASDREALQELLKGS